MLQANDNDGSGLSVVTFTSIEQELADNSANGPCSASGRFIELFEELTGWKVEFQESRDSIQARTMPSMESAPALGSLSIVDMSSHWPANKPTVHRGKCDELIEVTSQIVAELQETRAELMQTRSALAALAPEKLAVEDAVVVDSFVPKFSSDKSVRAVNFKDSDFIVVDPVEIEECFGVHHDDFEIHPDVEVVKHSGVPSTTRNVAALIPPFAGWSLGGAPGISDGTYVDWRVSPGEQICISVGRIESSLGVGDAEANFKVDPLTSEFFLAGTETVQTFYSYDRRTTEISKVIFSNDWKRVRVGDALIACSHNLSDLSELAMLFSTLSSPCEMANSILETCPDDACVLVLRRD